MFRAEQDFPYASSPGVSDQDVDLQASRGLDSYAIPLMPSLLHKRAAYGRSATVWTRLNLSLLVWS
jgi:hypothetical protein